MRAPATTTTAWGSVTEFPPFSGRPGPSLGGGSGTGQGNSNENVGFTADATYGFERSARALPLGRLFAWGPAAGDWDGGSGRWQARWDWAWSGWPDARASAQAPVPWASLDATRHAFGLGPGGATQWTLAPGDGAEHALLVGRHTLPAPGNDLFVLESDLAPLAVARPGGESFPEVQSAIRSSGRWYVATSEDPGEAPATVVWELDGGVARERARVPRGGFDTRSEARLARRTDGRALGLVIEGQPDVARPPGLWVTGLDLESGAVSDPEGLGPTGGRPAAVCAPGDTGWEFDLAYPGAIDLEIGDRWTATLLSPVGHVRASRDRVCVDRLFGAADPFAAAAPSTLSIGGGGGVTSQGARPASGAVPGAAPGAQRVDVGVYSGRMRYELRCDTHRP
jgi:hypothetical protein